MLRTLNLIILFGALILNLTPLRASVPQVISYQGMLSDGSGVPVSDSTYSVTFVIYGVQTGGIELWNSGVQSVATTNGLYIYLLGGNVAFPSDLFAADSERWLGVQVGTDPELSPRLRLTAVAYAFQAESADFAQSVAAGAIGAAEIDDSEVQNRITGTAGAGEFIKAINRDGTVVTGNDQNSGGDISAVNAGTGLSGGGDAGMVTLGVAPGGISSVEIADGSIGNTDVSPTAAIDVTKISGTAMDLSSAQAVTGAKTFDDLSISTTTRYLALSSAGFVNGYSQLLTFRIDVTGDVQSNPSAVTGSDVWLFAPICLPDGCRVTELRASLQDAEATEDMMISFYAASQTVLDTYSLVAQVASSGTPGFTTVSSGALSEIIDNSSNFYFVFVNWNKAASYPELYFRGVRITYEVTKPLP